MDYILKSRGRGKTYDLIQRSAQTGERIICASTLHARFINEEAKRLDLKIPEAKSIDYLVDNNIFNNDKILIDEMYLILKQILQVDISAITDSLDSVVLDLSCEKV